jgi:hypothetical protein
VRQHGVRVLSERDRELLQFVAEQYLVTLPQLAYLADRCPRTARWLRTRWQRAGLIDATPLLVEEPTVVWLTRHGLAALGLPWKSVRPSYANVQTAATLVELRLASRERYPEATWLSRRMLSHASPVPSPLPDALLTTDQASVAVLVKARELDRRELERQLIPLIASYEHTLLVLPTVSRHTREWFQQFAGQATAISSRRDPRTVTLPQLPPTLALEHHSALSSEKRDVGAGVDRCGVSPTCAHTAVP